MKKRMIAAGLFAALMCIPLLSGCKDNTPKNRLDAPEKVKQVGQIPQAFGQIVANDVFNGITAFDGRLLKVETVAKDEENRTVTSRVLMMDLYGKTLAAYTCSSDDAYHINTLTATKDCGFLFVLGFSDYAYDQNTWASDKGFASRIIKCDRDGSLQFDTALEKLEGAALSYCFERNGNFYFFGTAQAPETTIQGIHSPTDIYMVIISENGCVLKSQRIAGADYDSLHAAESSGDGFVLTISSQSDDGDFTGSDSNGYPTGWVFTVDDNLEITDRKKENGRDYFDDRIGEKDGVAVYQSDALLKDFDAGSPVAFIDYGDFYLIVSSNITGIYENTPAFISSIWYYTETVYSAYDDSGKLLFRASVDSSPDYDGKIAAVSGKEQGL